VPIGYLITVVVPALATAAALAPVRRGWALGQLSWRLGFQVNELPMLIAAWLVAATVLGAAQGDLNTPVGVAAASLALLTVTGLGVVLRRGMQAAPAAARALADGLGTGWHAELASRTAIPAQRRPWLRLLFAPLAVRRHDVVRQADLSYGPAGRWNQLDVYRPRSGPANGPCLVYFHGGGYRSGRKNREARALIYRLAGHGWFCVSANYRLARAAPYPAPLVDAKRLIAWLREHAPALGADPTTIVVAGSSAGAHLAAMAALTPNVAALQPGFERADTHVCAAICLYGFYGSPTWVGAEPGALSAPVEIVHEEAPPMLVVHGTHDSFVSVDDARAFTERFRIRAPGSPLVYLELPGAQHTFDLYNSVRFHAVVDAAALFTAWVTDWGRRTPPAPSGR
jgi:acetyl esterase/lipase